MKDTSQPALEGAWSSNNHRRRFVENNFQLQIDSKQKYQLLLGNNQCGMSLPL